MQLYILASDYRDAVTKLLEHPAGKRAIAVNLREGMQMLGVALWHHYGINLTKKDGNLYSTKNHENHPIIRWLKQDEAHTAWLLRFMRCLAYAVQNERVLEQIDRALGLAPVSTKGVTSHIFCSNLCPAIRDDATLSVYEKFDKYIYFKYGENSSQVI